MSNVTSLSKKRWSGKLRVVRVRYRDGTVKFGVEEKYTCETHGDDWMPSGEEGEECIFFTQEEAVACADFLYRVNVVEITPVVE